MLSGFEDDGKKPDELIKHLLDQVHLEFNTDALFVNNPI